jgi:hypothetical protein
MLVAAFMPPGFWQALGTDGSIRALALAAIGGTAAQAGQSVIATFLLDVIERLRKRKRLPGTEAELRQELERQLLAAFQVNDQRAAQLRADAAAILEQVQGVEAALEAATGDLRQALAEAPPDARLLLLVDQFEEVFTLCQEEDERRRFIRALHGLAGDANARAAVVLGIRADFYARCADHPELAAAIQDNQALVGPMTQAELRRSIEDPAARAGLRLEPGLVETVLGELGDEPGRLPLLSHALFATWQRRADGR